MPGYDGTGPEGTAPYGRGLGPCGQGYQRGGRGFFGFWRHGGGAGRGFGPRRWFTAAPAADEKTWLDSEKQWLSQQMDAINKRLDELEKDQ